MNLLIVCATTNDLCGVLKDNNIEFKHFFNIYSAVQTAHHGDALMVLADGYPEIPTRIEESTFELIYEKSLRLYIEFASYVPQIETGVIQKTKWERCIVASDAMHPDLEQLRILAIHSCHYIHAKAQSSHLVVGKVAGFDRAIYGLPSDFYPILFEHPSRDILISTTKLSQFVTARYAPYDALKSVWKWVLNWLLPLNNISELNWKPLVSPTYSPSEELPDDAEIIAMRRCVQWFTNAKLFIHKSWKDTTRRVDKLYASNPPVEEMLAPAPDPDWPVGDGSHGMIEGADATINPDGSQLWRYYLRSDCIGETSMAMAFSGILDSEEAHKRIAENLNDFLYFTSNLTGGKRAEQESPSYGLITWSTNDPRGGVYYSDDNARCLLGTIAASALLNECKWDQSVLKCILANLRTSGIYGFKGSRLEDEDMQKTGLKNICNSKIINYSPHYESWIWACYLWAYHKTRCKTLLEKSKTAIRLMMKAYPGQWLWTNGIQQELGRMLLPLSWLVRIEDTTEHRGWLRRIAQDFLDNQHKSGGIAEKLGIAKNGKYAPPISNEAYGTNEAPLIQENGDPLCDLLYTMNFAFLGLHEAAKATNEQFYEDSVNKMAEFFCRIQIRSESHLELDGAWFRAFDFNRWEYWGSSADSGWGAWCIESGWTQTWILAVLALRRMNLSLWELSVSKKFTLNTNDLISEMLSQSDCHN